MKKYIFIIAAFLLMSIQLVAQNTYLVNKCKIVKSEKCTNPEQLFACAYGVCFLSALNLILQKERLPNSDTKLDIYVHLNEGEKQHFLSVDMDVYIPDVEPAKAQKVLETAHSICPYSKAVRNNVEVNFNLVD